MATTTRSTTAKKTAKRTGKRTAAKATKATKRVTRSAPAKKAKKTAKRTVTSACKAVKKQTGAAKRTTKAVASSRRPSARKATARKTTGRSTASRPAAGDAIAVLKQDHREVEALFKRFEKAGSGAVRAKEALVDSMIEALSRHAEIEELIFYPAVREQMPRSESDVLEALEEHHVVKVVLRELEGLDPNSERYDAKVTVMTELVRHHVKEEEGELFPKVRRRLDRRTLLDLGEALRNAKPMVPTRPHPAAPDEPPGNIVAGAAVAVMDRARGVGKRAVKRVRDELPTL